MVTLNTAKDHNRHSATWEGLTTAGNSDIVRYAPRVSLGFASLQIGGTLGGATVTFLGSNDGVTYTAITDVRGNAIAATTAAIYEISSAFAFFKPNVAGGAAEDIDVIVVHWVD